MFAFIGGVVDGAISAVGSFVGGAVSAIGGLFVGAAHAYVAANIAAGAVVAGAVAWVGSWFVPATEDIAEEAYDAQGEEWFPGEGTAVATGASKA